MNLFNALFDLLSSLLNWILSIFPQDPFLPFLNDFKDSLTPYINYLNWFINFEHLRNILFAWLGAIALFYAWMTLGRWLKVIGD